MNQQYEMPVLGDCSYELKALPYQDVARCSTFEEAVHLCIRRSIVWRTQDTWAELLGVSKSYFNQVINGGSPDKPRHMGHPLRSKLQRLAGNTAITQWEDLELKGQLICQINANSREAQLRAELAEIERMKQSA